LIIAAVLYLAGLLVLFLSSGIRSCIPELTLPEGRDPSERRQAALHHLGILSLLNFSGTIFSGMGTILLAGESSSLLEFPQWAVIFILALAAFSLSVILPSYIAKKHALSFLSVLRIPYWIISLPFRLPALLIFRLSGKENPDSAGWLVTPSRRNLVGETQGKG